VAEISKTADLALRTLLELRDAGPGTPASIAQRLQINRTVAHRLLVTLHQRGFVARREGRYVLGGTLISLAKLVEPMLRSLALPEICRLSEETRETVVMHVAEGTDALVIEQVVPAMQVVRVQHPIGSRHPLYRGASGRAILAFLDDAQTGPVLAAAPDREALLSDLSRIREDRYAVSYDELQTGVHGAAVPVFDGDGSVVAGLAILVPATRDTAVTERIERLQSAASRIHDGFRQAEAVGASH